LWSGGLDSILSALVLQKQGIDVTWISFETPFFDAAKARQASKQTGISLIVDNITTDYLKMLKNPACGYGKHMNPCMDCHALMFRLAGRRLERESFHFLFSGEVLGQRPMSQTRPSLRYVEKHSGFDGCILRPLSARNLPETQMEKDGLVDRSRLLSISGRGRKEQIELARQWGITDYPAPAGGCLLTDKGYSNRLKDLFQHQTDYRETDLRLLKFGRHFRLTPQVKLVVGRARADNEQIMAHIDAGTDIVLKTVGYPGPIAVVPGLVDAATPPHEAIARAAGICGGYSKAPQNLSVTVELRLAESQKKITVKPIQPADSRDLMIN
jgi:tRNA-specific 2-thiouridylase